EHLGYAGKEVGLVEKLVVLEKENDDLLDKNREQEEWIRRLKEELDSKTSSLTEAESSVSTLKGDLECLTVDLNHAEIVRHNYLQKLLPTAFQRLLSSNEYKKSLSDVFNQAIATGWSEVMKVERTHEDAEAILAGAADYDPHCKDTFMSAFDSLFTQSYLYVEKLVESFCLPLEISKICGQKEMHVTWPLALGLIQSVLCSEKSGHWPLDSSEASCISGNVRHLAIGT
nr:hypothetical protein [Tanacetum cinerariifolium]